MPEKSFLILKSNLTTADIKQITSQWDLDSSIFAYYNSPVEIARFIPLNSNVLVSGHLLVTFDLKKDAKSIEQELVPVFTIFDQNHLFIGSTAQVIEADTNNLKIIFANLFNQLDHINQKLNTVKQKIDYLDSVARETTKTKELKKVTDLTRELVYLKHTLDDQTESLRSFGKYLEKNQLASSADIASLMTKQSQLTKMIHIYTDLLNSISGLFTAMMDSHLNHLMKYLDSVALILAIPTLISGIWGMNIGGLPGRTNKNGFWIIITIASLLTIIWSIILKKKKYND